MGFYLRKSIKAGPFRFSLSRSGIGMSVGVPGLRVGTGPRGNYVHMGGGGLYYRATLPSGGRASAAESRSRIPQRLPAPSSVENYERIESGDVLAMVDESAGGLLEQMRAASTRIGVMPWVLGGAALSVLIALSAGLAGWLVVLVALGGALATASARIRDVAGRLVILFYDLEPDALAAYEELHHAFARLAGTDGIWNLEARAHTEDAKRNAGATQLVQRRRVRLHTGTPSVIRTNLDVPAIPSGEETLYFFPDRLLVSSPNGIGAVPYDELHLKIEARQFVESDPVPPDALEIGTTWQYVNRDGGPDRRFADNPRLPILLYEQVSFTSPSGLNELLQFSKTGGGESFRSAIAALAGIAHARRVPGSERHALPAGGTDVKREPSTRTNLAPGRFEGQVSGDVDGRLQGRAVFGVKANDRGDNILYIVLRHEGREADGEHSLTFSNRVNALPAPSRYSLGDMGEKSFTAGYSHETPGGKSGWYHPEEGGLLELDALEDDRIHGRIDFRAEGSNTYNLWAVGGHVRITARFVAERIEGDPYELALLPGEVQALADSPEGDEDSLSLQNFDDVDADDLDTFAFGVIRHIVIQDALPELVDTFAEHGMDEDDLRRVEALIYTAFPIETLIRTGHLGDLGESMRTAIRRAVAVHAASLAGISADVTLAMVEVRFEEYADTVFDSDSLEVHANGMNDLAERAYQRIVGGETDDYALLIALFAHFGTFSQAWEFGGRLAQLYEQYLVLGEAMWDEADDEQRG
jgi:hypothetical protein